VTVWGLVLFDGTLTLVVGALRCSLRP